MEKDEIRYCVHHIQTKTTRRQTWVTVKRIRKNSIDQIHTWIHSFFFLRIIPSFWNIRGPSARHIVFVFYLLRILFAFIDDVSLIALSAISLFSISVGEGKKSMVFVDISTPIWAPPRAKCMIYKECAYFHLTMASHNTFFGDRRERIEGCVVRDPREISYN